MHHMTVLEIPEPALYLCKFVPYTAHAVSCVAESATAYNVQLTVLYQEVCMGMSTFILG